MRVRCVATRPTARQVLLLGEYYASGATDYDLDLSREYTVLGLGHWHGVPWVEIATDSGWILPVPLFLFEITDARSSRYWEVSFDPATNWLTFRPPEFADPSFNSRLADGEPNAENVFKRVRRWIELEASQPAG